MKWHVFLSRLEGFFGGVHVPTELPETGLNRLANQRSAAEVELVSSANSFGTYSTTIRKLGQGGTLMGTEQAKTSSCNHTHSCVAVLNQMPMKL